MPKPSTWSSWETKARHGVLAAGLGAGAAIIGAWLGTWLPHSVFSANVFVAAWAWNAWLWLVFAPMALVVARVFPLNSTSFVVVGGISGFLFWFFLDTALRGFERFWAFPLYALSCLFWFAAGLFWAKSFARRGEHFFRKAKANTTPGDTGTPAAAFASQVPSSEAETTEEGTASKPGPEF